LFYVVFHRAPLRKESLSTTPYTSDASTEPTPVKPKKLTPNHKTTTSPTGHGSPSKRSQTAQERLLTSRSASDVTEFNLSFSPNKTNVKTVKSPDKALSPAGSFDHELGELERQLTDTRKSIDAKFYKSLANSASPFFRPSKTSGLVSPTENSAFSSNTDYSLLTLRAHDNSDDSRSQGSSSSRQSAVVHKRYPSDGPLLPPHSSDKHIQYASSSEGTESTIKSSFEPLKFSDSPRSISPSLGSSRGAMFEESTAYITPSSPTKRSLRNADPITFEISAKGGQVTQVKPSISAVEEAKNSADSLTGSLSDSGILDKRFSSSREALISDGDGPNRKGSLVTTKVRDASDIIHERSYGRDSPVHRDVIIRKQNSVDHTNAPTGGEHNKLTQRFSHQSSAKASKEIEKPIATKAAQKSPLSARDTAFVKALGSAARNKASKEQGNTSGAQKTRSNIILDDSLTDTFAKLESAFAMKLPSPDSNSRDDKRKRRRNTKRRSRNYEPPSTDSSDDDDSSPDTWRRGGIRIQLKRNDDPETASIASSKSEAEQSLEAAISDFHQSLSTMPEKNKNRNSGPFYSSDQSEPTEAPVAPTRSSRPPHVRYTNNRETRSKSQDFSSSGRVLKDNSCTRSTGSFENPTKRRSEAKITLTSLRPWSPPLKRVEPSASIVKNVKNSSKPKALVIPKEHNNKERRNVQEEVVELEEQIITETVKIEDQLSPLPGILPRPLSSREHSRYTNSLPGRSNKRRKNSSRQQQQQHLRSKSSKFLIGMFSYKL